MLELPNLIRAEFHDKMVNYHLGKYNQANSFLGRAFHSVNVEYHDWRVSELLGFDPRIKNRHLCADGDIIIERLNRDGSTTVRKVDTYSGV